MMMTIETVLMNLLNYLYSNKMWLSKHYAHRERSQR